MIETQNKICLFSRVERLNNNIEWRKECWYELKVLQTIRKDPPFSQRIINDGIIQRRRNLFKWTFMYVEEASQRLWLGTIKPP